MGRYLGNYNGYLKVTKNQVQDFTVVVVSGPQELTACCLCTLSPAVEGGKDRLPSGHQIP